jgi:stage II sporulation protein D
VRRALLAALFLLAGCGPPEPPEVPAPRPAPRPVPAERPPTRPPEAPQRPAAAPFAAGPAIRIGILVDVAEVRIGGGDPVIVRPGGSGAAIAVARGRTGTLRATPSSVTLQGFGADRVVTAPLTLEPAQAGEFVRIAGKDYRGKVEVRRGEGGLVVIDQLSFEEYLGGVVAAELGVSDEPSFEAVKAQAVIARTYAVKNLGRHRRQGFDLLATVSDQRFDGVAGETAVAWRALAETRGQVVTYDGAAIEAFFHSTCGGRTAAGREVFTYADRPYLRSVSDTDPDGQAWCRSSPRFQWTESWDAAALATALRRGLRLEAEEAGTVRSIEVTARSATGRATALRVRLRGRDVTVDGSNAVRRALPPADLDLLRSATFTLTTRNDGERIGRLELSGQGAGHGVGLCQWGAIGRARAGQGYPAILSAYYPGTRLERRW